MVEAWNLTEGFMNATYLSALTELQLKKKQHCHSIYEEVLHLVVRHVTDRQDGGFLERLVQLVKQNL